MSPRRECWDPHPPSFPWDGNLEFPTPLLCPQGDFGVPTPVMELAFPPGAAGIGPAPGYFWEFLPARAFPRKRLREILPQTGMGFGIPFPLFSPDPIPSFLLFPLWVYPTPFPLFLLWVYPIPDFPSLCLFHSHFPLFEFIPFPFFLLWVMPLPLFPPWVHPIPFLLFPI